MKQIIYTSIILVLVFGCTSYDNDIKINVQDYKTLTPENIDTGLKVANLILDQAEFDEMYANYTEDIEIVGMLNLYKNGVTLIENEVVEVKVKGTSKDITTSLILLNEQGRFTQNSVSVALKKLSENIIKKLKL